MISNEELALRIKNGAAEYIPELWEQVRRYVEMRAKRYARNMENHCADVDDLIQAGYFAMLAAVRDYEPERGAKFLTCLTWAIQKEFAAVAGVRSTSRDAAAYADSLDAPLTDDPEAGTLHDLLADFRAQEPFLAVEEESYTHAVHDALEAVLNSLCDTRKQRLIAGMYFEGRSMTEAAELAGYTSKQGAERDHKWVLRRLRHCSQTRALRELLHGYDDVDIPSEAIRGVGVRRWKETGESATERVALKLTEGGEP